MRRDKSHDESQMRPHPKIFLHSSLLPTYPFNCFGICLQHEWEGLFERFGHLPDEISLGNDRSCLDPAQETVSVYFLRRSFVMSG